SYEEFTERAQGGKAVQFSWDTNKFHRFARLDKLPPTWDKQPPSGGEGLPKERLEAIRGINAALKNLRARLGWKGEDCTAAKAGGGWGWGGCTGWARSATSRACSTPWATTTPSTPSTATWPRTCCGSGWRAATATTSSSSTRRPRAASCSTSTGSVRSRPR